MEEQKAFLHLYVTGRRPKRKATEICWKGKIHTDVGRLLEPKSAASGEEQEERLCGDPTAESCSVLSSLGTWIALRLICIRDLNLRKEGMPHQSLPKFRTRIDKLFRFFLPLTLEEYKCQFAQWRDRKIQQPAINRW